MAGTIQSLIDIGERAYSNLYDVTLTRDRPVEVNPNYNTTSIFPLKAKVEKVNFGGNQTLGTFYSDAMMQSFVDKVTRIKQVTLSVRETYDYAFFNWMLEWQNSIYSFSGNYFISGNPSGTIEVVLLNTGGNTTLNTSTQGNKFTITGAVPTDLTFPSYSYSSADAIVTNITFTFDDVSFG